MSQFLTIEDVAKKLQISGRQIRRYIDEGILKSTRFGRLHRISEKQVEDFLKAIEKANK
jgi:excisionase family DNA binding protein